MTSPSASTSGESSAPGSSAINGDMTEMDKVAINANEWVNLE
jgi:hypothetical protein